MEPTRTLLKGHMALITGASSGIGEEFARQLAELGSDLILAARRTERLAKLALELKTQFGTSVTCIRSDLSQPNGAELLYQNALLQGRPITCLINNAGVGNYGPFVEFPYDEHSTTLQVNLIAPTQLTYLITKHMLNHGQKSYITQVASIAAFQPVGFFSIYSASKGYLRTFSETLAFELRRSSIHVLCVCPGGTYTEFFEHSGQKITPTGRATMMTAKAVVRSSLQAMLSEKTVFVPGLINKIACFLPRLFPRGLSLYLAFKAMNRSVERVLPASPKQTL